MEQIRYDSIVDIADHYYFGAMVLLREANSFEKSGRIYDFIKLTTPKVTLASVACEMYLKALVYRETNADKPETGHDLKGLFEKINETDQDWIREEFNKWIGNDYNFDYEMDDSIKNSFKDWRYLYEKGWLDKPTSNHIRSGSVTTFMELLYKTAHKYYSETRK